MKRIFWLDKFKGTSMGGAYYRSRIALDVDDFEKKFNKNIVGIAIENKIESDKPSWNIEFYIELKEDG